MKSNNVLPGLILFVIGIYFLAAQWEIHIPFADELLRWPTILFGIGAVMMWQGFSNKDGSSMFSGTVLTGLGVLFHGASTFQLWQYDWPYFTLVIGVAFLLKHSVRRREGLGTGLILLAVTAVALFSSRILPLYQNTLGGWENLWPIVLIAVGVYLVFFRKGNKPGKKLNVRRNFPNQKS